MATNRTPREIAGELEDCAVLFKEHATWQSTLMAAIQRIVHTDNPLTAAAIGADERKDIDQLATIADYLADMARDNATRYLDKAVALRGAA